MKEKGRKKLFISGPITDTPFYWRTFEEARDFYEAEGYAVMNPAELPVGMSNADYARICLSMIDSADEVAFLPGWHESIGAKLEHDYCYYIRKPVHLYGDAKNGVRNTLFNGCKGDREKCEKVAEEGLKKFCGSDADDRVIRITIDVSALPDLLDEAHSDLFCKFCEIKNELADALDTAASKAFTEGVEPEVDRREQIDKLYEEAAENMRKEKAKIDDAVKAGDPLFVWRSEEEETPYALVYYSIEQAIDHRYNVDLSADKDGWISVSLVVPNGDGK